MMGKSVAGAFSAAMFAVFAIVSQQPLFLVGSVAALAYALFAWRGERQPPAEEETDHDEDG